MRNQADIVLYNRIVLVTFTRLLFPLTSEHFCDGGVDQGGGYFFSQDGPEKAFEGSASAQYFFNDEIVTQVEPAF